MVPECAITVLAYFEEKQINISQGIQKTHLSPRVPAGCGLAVAVAVCIRK